ncbi:MAG: TlpA family protein disulfide reductase [Gammaproteobacteria bacterium]|nr:TlpA family protein disulfide reductase [Gammaproteobacteria bacterium]
MKPSTSTIHSDYRSRPTVARKSRSPPAATWCAPCLREMPELERFYQQNRARAQVWGVSFEDGDKATIRAYVDRLGVTFPILGHGQNPMTGYGEVNVLPTTFIIDPDGLFRHRFEGPITADDIVTEISRAR